VAEAAGTVLKSSPGRLTGRQCLRITFAERPNRPARFCNRYVSSGIFDPFLGPLGNPIAFNAAMDASTAFTLIEQFTGPTPHVAQVRSEVELRRGERVAFLRKVKAPKRVRSGQKNVSVKVTMQRLRGTNFTKRYRINLPGGIKPGKRTLKLSGFQDELDDEDILALLFGIDVDGEEPSDGPTKLNDLIETISSLGRWDGVHQRINGKSKRAFKDDDLVIVGNAETRLHVLKRKR